MVLNWVLLFWSTLFFTFQSEEPPAFRGGKNALQTFISKNLIYPSYSRQNCIQGTIQISFKLSSSGVVFDSKVHRGYGIDLDYEALRIIRLTSGKWIVPANFDTTSVIVLPVSFALSDNRCKTRSASDIRNAINAYRDQQELTNAITNFYEKKDEGQYSPGDQEKIDALKKDLGYNEQFIEEVIEQAMKKIEQGDKEGACEDLKFIKKIGSEKADELIVQHCQ